MKTYFALLAALIGGVSLYAYAHPRTQAQETAYYKQLDDETQKYWTPAQKQEYSNLQDEEIRLQDQIAVDIPGSEQAAVDNARLNYVQQQLNGFTE
jgi:hypothetical protein